MNITAIIFAAVVVGGVGILIGFFLGVSGEKFKVEVPAQFDGRSLRAHSSRHRG